MPQNRAFAAYLAIAEDDPFLAGQSFEADRATGVDLVGGDADFGAESILEAVGKAVEALIMTDAESTSRRKRIALVWFSVMMASVWPEL